jgi:hypothetical protein
MWVVGLVVWAVTLPVSAQAETPWVDPPANLATPPVPVTPSPSQAPQEQRSSEGATTPEIVKSSPLSEQVSPPAATLEQPKAARPTQAAKETAPGSPEPVPSKASPNGTSRSSGPPTPPEITLGLKAEQITLAFLEAWSAPNPTTFSEMPTFYGREVVFHGQRMDSKAVMKAKRRFAQRWPDREYKPRPEAMRIGCDARAELCKVRTVVDFVAANGRRGVLSEGTHTMSLDILFVDGRAMIAAENSRVIARGLGTADDE